MIYLLDTNVLIHLVRGTEWGQHIIEKYRLSEKDNEVAVSIVSVGELRSLALQNNWGEKRIDLLLFENE